MSKNLSQLTAITAADTAAADLLYLFDVSEALGNRSKAMTRAEAQKMFARFYVPMRYVGELTDEQSFGYFLARINCKLVGIDWTIGDKPTGGDTTFDVTVDGVEQAAVTTITEAGNYYGQQIFAQAINLDAAQAVRLKVKSAGLTTPGAWLDANLILEPRVA